MKSTDQMYARNDCIRPYEILQGDSDYSISRMRMSTSYQSAISIYFIKPSEHSII